MSIQLDTDNNPFTGQQSLALSRAQIDYQKDGSITVGVFFAPRVTNGSEVLEGQWQRYERNYLDLSDLISKAAVAANVTEPEASAVITGFVNMLWGMKAAIDQEVATP